MADSLVDSAEEYFLANNLQSASDFASLAASLDPFFGSVQRYAAAFAVHAATLTKTASGETDWYRVLQINNPSTASTEEITHQFIALGKLVDPAFHCSAAAPDAYRLITSAWEVLSVPEKRYKFDIRSGLMKAPETKVMKKVVASSTTEKTEPKQHSRLATASSRDTNKVEIRSCLTAASRVMRVHPRFRDRPSIC